MVDSRIGRVQRQLVDGGHDALLVGPGADLRWLIGYHALPLERLTLLIVPADGDPTLIVPRLETPRAVAQGADRHASIVDWDETADPLDLVVAALPGSMASVAVQDRLWTSFTLQLQDRLDVASWVPGTHVVGPLRIVKDADEIAALHAVGRAIDRVHARVPQWLRAGRTERKVGRDIAEAILEEHDEVNFVIVAGGPNGASPHHETSDRMLERGDAVVIDIGGTLDGYCSDVTRNYAIGEVPPAYAELHEVLEQAQRTAVEAVRPGVTAASVDAAARQLLTDAGHGEHFLHRTGHGIGVEEHEEPWIVAGNDTPLRPGMAFSVEPGIYVADTHGARIEDIVVVTDDGADSCNHQPTSLTVVGVVSPLDDSVRVRRARIEEIRPLAERYAREAAAANADGEPFDVPLPQGGIFWIAEEDDHPVGYAAGTLRPTGCVVGPVYTEPHHRRRGVGEALLMAIQGWAGGTRVPIVEISVASGNEAGIAFLRSLGYEPRRTLMTLTPTRVRGDG